MAKILVADDNSNIQKMVGLALKDQGIDVVAVGNGEAAVRKISDVRPDLVLADVFMPVRNGYEVCRYVKEDSSLSHIPVILLVGAFDPLDEQEAQRVGADGVLKKPFVPPDPLISMVKSALLRAGVPLGPSSAEKAVMPPPPPSRSAADLLGGAHKAPSVAAPSVPEPIEEFPSPMPHVKIPEGQGPLAFGNLMGSTETEEEPVVSSKPMINIANERSWEDEPNEVPEEEDEEEASHGGWRPGAIDEDLSRAQAEPAGGTDWRDEGFHGSSPAHAHSSRHWSPAVEEPAVAEVSESRSVALSTLASQPVVDPASPFASDAWAAAIASGVEEKLTESGAIPAVASEPEAETAIPPVSLPSDELAGTIAASLQSGTVETPVAAVHEEATPAGQGNWAVVPEASWEVEAKRASMLASTWDVAPPPPPVRSMDETQDVSAYVAEPHPAGQQPEVTAEAEASSAYSGHWEREQASEPETAVQSARQEAPAAEPVPESGIPKGWETAWEAPKVVEAPAPEIEHAVSEPPTVEVTRTHGSVAETTSKPAAQESLAVPARPAEPDMDELVARVLGKMSPEVLQKVTHEILKPVIEAIVRDELGSKKS